MHAHTHSLHHFAIDSSPAGVPPVTLQPHVFDETSHVKFPGQPLQGGGNGGDGEGNGGGGDGD